MFDSCILLLKSDSQVRLGKGGVEAQYGIVWQVAIAYDFLAKLGKGKLEVKDRPEPRYYSSCINSTRAKLNKYYTKLDKTPVYYAAMVFHTEIQLTFS
jgi:hypothetical protein